MASFPRALFSRNSDGTPARYSTKPPRRDLVWALNFFRPRRRPQGPTIYVIYLVDETDLSESLYRVSFDEDTANELICTLCKGDFDGSWEPVVVDGAPDPLPPGATVYLVIRRPEKDPAETSRLGGLFEAELIAAYADQSKAERDAQRRHERNMQWHRDHDMITLTTDYWEVLPVHDGWVDGNALPSGWR